jgi:DNA-binding MarR family transcriptional regulator
MSSQSLQFAEGTGRRLRISRCASREVTFMSMPKNAPRQTLGTLLRLAHTGMVNEYSRWLAGSPYTDIQPAHAAAIQPLWQLPEGARLTKLARTAGITKQSMAALVASLEQNGYVERMDDPDDGRASRLRLTARGKQYGRDIRKFSMEIEDRTAARIGAKKLEDLRAALKLLVDSMRPSEHR